MNTNNGNNDRDASKFWTYRDTGYSESIDEAFASIQDSHIELSQMADSKANILITVTSILLTLAVSEIGNGGLVITAASFSIFSVPALIFAILSVMPSSSKPIDFQPGNHLSNKYNPLFFMHFTQMPIEDFEKKLERIMADPENLYRYLGRDIYNSGMVLRLKKYRYLRWSYLFLMTGIAIGIIALFVELISFT